MFLNFRHTNAVNIILKEIPHPNVQLYMVFRMRKVVKLGLYIYIRRLKEVKASYIF